MHYVRAPGTNQDDDDDDLVGSEITQHYTVSFAFPSEVGTHPLVCVGRYPAIPLYLGPRYSCCGLERVGMYQRRPTATSAQSVRSVLSVRTPERASGE